MDMGSTAIHRVGIEHLILVRQLRGIGIHLQIPLPIGRALCHLQRHRLAIRMPVPMWTRMAVGFALCGHKMHLRRLAGQRLPGAGLAPPVRQRTIAGHLSGRLLELHRQLTRLGRMAHHSTGRCAHIRGIQRHIRSDVIIVGCHIAALGAGVPLARRVRAHGGRLGHARLRDGLQSGRLHRLQFGAIYLFNGLTSVSAHHP